MGRLTIIFLLLLSTAAQAQRTCGTTRYVQEQVQANPLLQEAYNQVEQQIQNTLALQLAARDTLANEIISIPVVVHVLYKTAAQNISTQQVLSQIAVLNQDYRMANADSNLVPLAFRGAKGDARIKFCLAQVDPKGYRTTGINRKYTNNDYFLADDGMKYTSRGGVDAWDSKRYLNIWVCNIFGRVLGYGTPPGTPADKDGVVIMHDVFGTVGNVRAPFNKGRTTTHEVGHWLGLKHLWGDNECGDDGVDDTPRQKSFNFGCPTFPRLSDCSPNGNGDMFMNFMDYTDDACMGLFTNGQKKRIRALFATGSVRNLFLNAYGCDSTLAQGGPLPDLTPAPIAASIKLFPNPFTASITIYSSDVALVVGKTATLYNAQGLPLLKQTISKAETKMPLNFLPAGVYLLEVGNSDSKAVHKIVKL
jgi:Pregnancy-associated plasma protein-A/Secretion system C-terminal sorting domain